MITLQGEYNSVISLCAFKHNRYFELTLLAENSH